MRTIPKIPILGEGLHNGCTNEITKLGLRFLRVVPPKVFTI